MTGAYKINDIAYMIESNRYIREGRKYTSAGVPFTARQGKWIGAKVGLFSTAPYGKERGWL